MCAKFYLRPDGSPFIKSFAHGGAYYKLLYDYDGIEAAVSKADPKEAVKVFVRLVIDAGLDLDEEKRLAKVAGLRSGSGVKVAEQMLKKARNERSGKAAAASAKPGFVRRRHRKAADGLGLA